jgi:hypothetical protein
MKAILNNNYELYFTPYTNSFVRWTDSEKYKHILTFVWSTPQLTNALGGYKLNSSLR